MKFVTKAYIEYEFEEREWYEFLSHGRVFSRLDLLLILNDHLGERPYREWRFKELVRLNALYLDLTRKPIVWRMCASFIPVILQVLRERDGESSVIVQERRPWYVHGGEK